MSFREGLGVGSKGDVLRWVHGREEAWIKGVVVVFVFKIMSCIEKAGISEKVIFLPFLINRQKDFFKENFLTKLYFAKPKSFFFLCEALLG